MRPWLGTFVEIGAQGCPQTNDAVEAAFHAVAEVHALLSFHALESDLSKLNAANGQAVALHPHSLRVLRLACAMGRVSHGLFNCTVGGALVRCGVLPDHGVAWELDCGSAEDIELYPRHARLRRKVLVTLDGIAKGYAVDCAIRTLRRYGATGGWVNAGGDLRAFGDVTLPVMIRGLDGQLTPIGGLKDAALATSCVREVHDLSYPSWIVGEMKPPRIGTWSVLANTAWRADALTKVACMAEDAQRDALIQALGGRVVEQQEEAALCA